MQLLRLRCTICRHHPPQMAVLSKICCFGECKVVLFQILLDSAEPRDAGTTWFSSPVCRRGSFCFLSMRIICPNRVSRCDWITAVSLGCFVGLRTSSFRTNWYHLMPSSICRHHWSSALILRASVLDITQQSEPYRTSLSWRDVTSKSDFLSSASQLMSQVLLVIEWIREPR